MSQLQDFHDFARGHLHGFTGREWLGDRVRAWRENEGASRIQVIVGGPGVGKSAFAAHLWLDLGMVDAAHFCIAGQGGTVEPLAFVRSLGEQLAGGVPGFANALARSRDDVLVHIAAFAPVLAKLGIISATWDRLQAVETLLSGQR